MKTCRNCNIKIGGSVDTCPLCQNSLTGEPSADNWPAKKGLKTRALLYKLQLFIVLTVIVVGLSLDFLLNLNNGKHYSLIIALWLIVFEMDLRSNLKRLFVISRTVNFAVYHIILLMLITGWYYGFSDLVIFTIAPILTSALIIVNLILSLTDRSGNALVYLLANILAVLVAYIAIRSAYHDARLVWAISLMTGAISLIGIIIFKGHKVLNEVQKRMNF